MAKDKDHKDDRSGKEALSGAHREQADKPSSSARTTRTSCASCT